MQLNLPIFRELFNEVLLEDIEICCDFITKVLFFSKKLINLKTFSKEEIANYNRKINNFDYDRIVGEEELVIETSI